MATLKQRLHKKNASGTYDTVHLETSSSMVLRPSGRTVEQDLSDLLPKVQDNDNVPESLRGGLVSGLTKVWAGSANGPIDLTNSECKIKLQETDTKPSAGSLDKGNISIGPNKSFVKTNGDSTVKEIATTDMNFVQYTDGSTAPDAVGVDAYTLQGHGPTYFAKASDMPEPYVHPAEKQCNIDLSVLLKYISYDPLTKSLYIGVNT